MSVAETRGSFGRLLFIGPETYDYHRCLQESLHDLGVEHVFVGENNLDISYRMARVLGPAALDHYLNRWWQKVEIEIEKGGIEKVLVVRGEMLRRGTMELLRMKLPDAKFVMYQWDSLSNHDYSELVEFFDVVYSFDRVDSKKHGFNYMPLFYDKEFSKLRATSSVSDFDLLMVGSLHSDRLSIAKKIQNQAEAHGLNTFLFLYTPPFTWIKKTLTGKGFGYDKDLVKFRPISKGQYLNLLQRSKVVLDINNTNQAGLTIRTMETLGAGKKLVTTNEFITEDSFFDQRWIDIIDRNGPQLNLEFFNPVDGFPDVDAFRVDHWITKVLF